MRKLVALVLMMTVVAWCFAEQNVGGDKNDEYLVYWDKASAILETVANIPVGDLTFNEMRAFALDISVPFQEMQFVKDSKSASAMIPGLGQYMNNEPISGTLFLLSDLAIVAGTVVTAYHFLPEDLKFNNLDYASESSATIEAIWNAQSSEDMAPSIGIVAAGILTSSVVRIISSANAGKLAHRNIAEGRITFEPKLLFPNLLSAGTQISSVDGFGLAMGLYF